MWNNPCGLWNILPWGKIWNKIRSFICRRHISYAKRISYYEVIFHSFRKEWISLKKARHGVLFSTTSKLCKYCRFQGSTQNQIATQRSGCNLERRSDGMSERWRLLWKRKRRRERYAVRDDVVETEGFACILVLQRKTRIKVSTSFWTGRWSSHRLLRTWFESLLRRYWPKKKNTLSRAMPLS